MEHKKYLIIGAGISGLAFADWLDSDDYLICEADAKIGGYCKTIVRNGFTWDYSGHFFHFKDPEIEKYLIDRMSGEQVFKIKKSSKIFWDGSWIDFPFQKNIHQLPQSDFIDCMYDLHFRTEVAPKNFKEMLYSKFGAGIADRFLIPYNEKLYATNLASLDMNAMGRFFPYADVSAIIKNFKFPDNSSYNDLFTYPKGGAIQYVNALAKDIPEGHVVLNERVVEIDVNKRIVKTNRREMSYESLISSAPLVDLLGYCGIEKKSETYTWNKVLVFNLGFDAKGLSDVHWAYFPQLEVSFYRVGFYDNILRSERMSLYVEIGLDRNANTSDEEINFYLERVLSDLRATGIVTTQNLVDWHFVVMNPAYVHITEGSIDDAARNKQLLSNHGIHSIGRYGGWTYCSIEDNIVEARALADTFNAVELLR